MKKLTNAQDAIEQAIQEGGLDKGKVSTEYALTQPYFWQALGNARGWTEYRPKRNVIGDSWKDYAADWFETRLTNGDETKFWQSLP